MNYRLFWTGFFLAVLIALVAWAFRWALDSWKEVTFDLPGEVTVLRFIKGPQTISSAEAESAQEELKVYLYQQRLALIVSSSGDNRPEIQVYDPHNLVPWFPECPSEEGQSTVSVYLFRGTYSERLWERSSPNPFLPPGASVKGMIAAPRRSGTLQYARCVGNDLLPEGQYAINTTDPVKVQHILSLLHRMGFVAQETRRLPFFLSLIQDPLMVTTAFLVFAGYGCVVLYWMLYLYERSREFGIRARHGARPVQLVGENFVNGLPGLTIGSLLGGVFAGVLVAAIGQVNLSAEEVFTLGMATIVTAVITALTWMSVLFFSWFAGGMR
jgi:hypothetical protein